MSNKHQWRQPHMQLQLLLRYSLNALLQHDWQSVPFELLVTKGSGNGQNVTHPAVINPATSLFNPVTFRCHCLTLTIQSA